MPPLLDYSVETFQKYLQCLNLRIDKGSHCVLRHTYILLITLIAFILSKCVEYNSEMVFYELSDDINNKIMY